MALCSSVFPSNCSLILEFEIKIEIEISGALKAAVCFRAVGTSPQQCGSMLDSVVSRLKLNENGVFLAPALPPRTL